MSVRCIYILHQYKLVLCCICVTVVGLQQNNRTSQGKLEEADVAMFKINLAVDAHSGGDYLAEI